MEDYKNYFPILFSKQEIRKIILKHITNLSKHICVNPDLY